MIVIKGCSYIGWLKKFAICLLYFVCFFTNFTAFFYIKRESSFKFTI